ncbi:MAG TPA: FAD-binding protein, partial [Gemmatimonadaceae bacterium]|nr:FAD-binding protein [Gemmatimonadaceae bacterium]
LERVRRARESGNPLRVSGAGTWLGAGRPVAGDACSLAEDRGIVEYVPGDLTLTARAGTTLADIDVATREHDQWLPLDPWGGDAGTIGATVSTASSGPHAWSMGLPRDVVLGVELVTGAGHVVRAGGRVVKNVAGFDLTRLTVGSWGTIGVITEVVVRLRARFAHTRSLALPAPSEASGLSELAMRLRALPVTLAACELVDARVAERLGLPGESVVVRVAGNRRAVDAAVDLVAGVRRTQDADDDVWPKIRALEPRTLAIWRWSQLPSAIGATWRAAAEATRDIAGVVRNASLLRGVVRVVVPSATSTTAAQLGRAATSFSGTVAIDALPADAWKHVPQNDVADPLSRAIREKFDPARVLNRGILGDP